MRLLRLSPLLVLVAAALSAQPPRPGTVVTADIGRFWRVFDKVTATSDTSLQQALIQSQYIDSATPGLRAMMTARRYNAAAFSDAIQRYPKFWRSVRANTLRATELEQGIAKLRAVYPQLLVVTHEEIRGLLSARTTGFRAAASALRDPIRVGEAIRFSLRGTGADDATLVAIAPW